MRVKHYSGGRGIISRIPLAGIASGLVYLLEDPENLLVQAWLAAGCG